MDGLFHRKEQGGFTLIELMIVIAIIGILAAIAIPQFSAYKNRSYNTAVQTDLRNAATAQEAYYVDKQCYESSPSILVGATYGFYASENVYMSGTSGTDRYTMTAYHSLGDTTYFLIGPGGTVTH